MRFYLSGQRSFANRGCEAIVRSTVKLIREQEPQAQFLVPSTNLPHDKGQWPEHIEHGVEFVSAYLPRHARIWSKVQRNAAKGLSAVDMPLLPPPWFRSQLESVDAVIAIGGDNYSLDYGVPNLHHAIDAYAMKLGIPVFLWGASVGPFDSDLRYERRAIRHLSSMKGVYVREALSEKYLRECGLENISLFSDPAFHLSKETSPETETTPRSFPTVGLNLSPLIEKMLGRERFATKIAELVDALAQATGAHILLIPHVIFTDGRLGADDLSVMRSIRCARGNVRLVNPSFNAAQLKNVISQLDVFIGARTHATIAAISTAVPTLSIAYSRKAWGLNDDIFGERRWVIDGRSLEPDVVVGKVSELLSDNNSIRLHLESIGAVKRSQGNAMASALLRAVHSS